MPRIDPQQLLSCLTVLLNPNGGILSTDVVQRLASLMTKFSKKLVSKCVYVLILKNTEKQLLDVFMSEGGWDLVFIWIRNAEQNKNWPLVKELLELLLITPVDVERLKSNDFLPKLIKTLSKREELEGVHELASQLVELWLKIVKDQTQQDANQPIVKVVPTESIITKPTDHITVVQVSKPLEAATIVNAESADCYKLAVRDGKHILCKVPASEANVTVIANAVIEEVKLDDVKADYDETDRKDEKAKENKERSSKDKDKKKSSSGSSKSISRDHDKNRSSSSSKGRDKDRSSSSRSKERRDKDRHRSNGSLKSSSSKSSSNGTRDKKESKERQAERDKDTLAKIQPQSLNKLGRIPKKSSDDKLRDDEKRRQEKKASMGIETKNPNEPRPKTVKVYNAKMRSTGLLEEAKPPPPRPVKKSTSTTLPASIPVKRPSPIRDPIPPPDKKPRIEPAERPGSIKLIPPKPKPPVLQESDIFMDALNASASSKKETKKRKRRPSVNKETASSSSPPQSPSSGTTPTSPTSTNSLSLKGLTPANFYQDTLESNADEKMDVDEEKPDTDLVAEPCDDSDNANNTDGDNSSGTKAEDSNGSKGLKGVLLYTKKKGPKRSIRWKQDSDLVTIQYFELDETERVNVTRAFMDLAKMEMTGEREALQKSRKLSNEDVMDVQTNWRTLIEIEAKPLLVEPGCKSLEKDIQFAREKGVLQALYFGGKLISDTPMEPDAENHQMTDPLTIPLEDPDTLEPEKPIPPWPEPKGSPPPETMQNIPQLFTGAFPNFAGIGGGPPPPNFQSVPFAAPAANFLLAGSNNNNNENWSNGPRMPHNHMPPPDLLMANAPVVPGPALFPNPDFNVNANDSTFPGQFNQNPGMGMFPNNFHRGGVGGNQGGRGGFRGRGGGMTNGPWIRMNGPGPGPGWNPNRGGNMNRGGGRVCKNIRNHGYCRNRDNCNFYHPN